MVTFKTFQQPTGRARHLLAELNHRAAREAPRGKAQPGGTRWKAGEQFHAIFHRAADGDTIIVEWSPEDRTDEFPDRIRLADLDAPELYPVNQPGAIAAKLHLERLCTGQLLRIVPTHSWPDKYGRMIARIWTPDGKDINLAMVADGYARRYTTHSRRLRPPERSHPSSVSH